jgi:hypothetical protein
MIITTPKVSHQCSPGGLFIEVVIHDHYKVCNTPHSPILICHYIVIGSLQSFAIYKYFHAPRMMV